MGKHVVVGKGAVGNGLADVLVRQGHEVVQISRRGGAVDGARGLAFDAGDREALSQAARGAQSLYNCANPPYDRWVTDWPPIAASLLQAAESSGAGLVVMGNLYPYGPVDVPMTEDLPLAGTGTKARVRARMWQDALALHEAGRIRTTEARASDFYGPGVVDTGLLASRAVPPLLKGRTVRVLGDPDAPHSFSYVPDVARTLAVLGTDDRAWGRPWHVPTAGPVSQRAALTELARLAGVREPKVSRIPELVLTVTGLVVPLVRELGETGYQRTRPYVLDSSAAEQTFGLQPTPLTEGLATTLDWWQQRLAA